jgi:hypothetical protein
MNVNLISLAIDICGLQPLASACGVSYQAVRKWEKKGLPRTEWTGESRYAEIIEKETKRAITREQLLANGKAAA